MNKISKRMMEVLKKNLIKYAYIFATYLLLRTSKKANFVIFYIILGHAIKTEIGTCALKFHTRSLVLIRIATLIVFFQSEIDLF